MRTALLRLPDLVALRGVALAAPAAVMAGGMPARQTPEPRRRVRRKLAVAKN